VFVSSLGTTVAIEESPDRIETVCRSLVSAIGSRHAISATLRVGSGEGTAGVLRRRALASAAPRGDHIDPTRSARTASRSALELVGARAT
jgi:hypothetical protein